MKIMKSTNKTMEINGHLWKWMKNNEASMKFKRPWLAGAILPSGIHPGSIRDLVNEYPWKTKKFNENQRKSIKTHEKQ